MTTILPCETAARELRELGFWVIAIYPRGFTIKTRTNEKTAEGKEPIGAAWGAERWSERRLRETFNRHHDAGIGVCFGPERAPSGGWLIDLEGDGELADDSFTNLVGGELVETRGWHSRRGSHHVFEADGDRLLELLAAAGAQEGKGQKAGVWHLDEFPDLEWRAGGRKPDGTIKQCQSVVPPTLGIDGKPREWNGVETVTRLPEHAYQSLQALANKRSRNANQHPLPVGNGQTGTPYGRKALENEIAEFSRQTEGSRHSRLLGTSLRLASLACAGQIGEAECLSGLRDGARANGMGEKRFHEIDEAWVSARSMATPRVVPEQTSRKSVPGSSGDTIHTGNEYATVTDDDLGIIQADAVELAPIDWLWPYRFARGEMALLAGDGGLGKSSILLAIAAKITRGGEWPDRSGFAPVGDVVIVSAEDSRESTLGPRLRAMDADLARIKFVTVRLTIKRPGQSPSVSPKTLQDRGYWQELLRRIPACAMMIIDPLPSYLGRGVNDAKNADLRGVMEPFLDLVIRPKGVCLVCNTHLNKSIDTKTPLHRVSGSHAYGALPRNVHMVVRDHENPKRRLFAQAKCNNAPDDLPALAYTMTPVTIPSPKGEIETAYPVWEQEPVTLDLQAAMSPARDRSGPPSGKTLELAVWLLGYLRDAGQPVRLKEVFDAAGGTGQIGDYGPGKDGRNRWSGGTSLYHAKNAVVCLTGDDRGWAIEELKVDGRTHWQAIRTTLSDHRITGSPRTQSAASPY